jgi:hypothetical protein
MDDPSTGTFTTDQYVKALDDQGTEWQHHKDCQVGDWQRYLAEGGTIDPYVPEIGESVASAPTGLFGGPTMKEVFNG